MTTDAGGHLGIKNRVGDDAEQLYEDFDVLPCRMEHLCHMSVRKKFGERRQIDVVGKGVDDDRPVGGGSLDEAELWPICRFAQEFGVDGHEIIGRSVLAERFQRPRRSDDLH